MKKRILNIFIVVIISLFSTSAFASNTPNLNHAGYKSSNPFYNSGYGGQCTAFAFGRSYEKLGISVPFRGDAVSWWTRNSYYNSGSTPMANSIAVWSGNGTGHVAFVEEVSGDTVYFNEANWNTFIDNNWGGGYDGYVKSLSINNMKKRSNFTLLGYIYLGSNPTPSGNTWVKTDKTEYMVNENVKFTFGYKYGTSVSLGIFKNGERYSTPEVTGNTEYSMSFSETGTYTVYVSGWSPSGYEDSSTFTFKITNGGTSDNTWIQTDKIEYKVNESVNFKFGYKYGTSVSLGIAKNGERYSNPEVTGKTEHAMSFSETGTYTVYVSGWSPSGYEDSSTVTFNVTNGGVSDTTWIQSDKSIYSTGENIKFTFGYQHGISVSLGIAKNGERYSNPEVTGKTEYAMSFSEVGTYTIYVSGWSPYGYEDSSVITVNVVHGKLSIPNIFSKDYSDGKEVSIECEKGAQIYYTQDGSVPSENSIKYTGSFYVYKDTIINAIAILDDYEQSNIGTNEIKIDKKAAQLQVISTGGILGNNLDVFVSLNSEGVHDGNLTLSYDNTKLRIQDVEIYDLLTGKEVSVDKDHSENEIRISFDGGSVINGEDNILKLIFETLKEGASNIIISNVAMYDISSNRIDTHITNGTVSVWDVVDGVEVDNIQISISGGKKQVSANISNDNVMCYLAKYKNNELVEVDSGQPQEGNIRLSVDNDPNTQVKFMVWYKNMTPVIDAVTID